MKFRLLEHIQDNIDSWNRPDTVKEIHEQSL